jgi:hypothetical protein
MDLYNMAYEYVNYLKLGNLILNLSLSEQDIGAMAIKC